MSSHTRYIWMIVFVSALICTRNRAESTVNAVRSLLAHGELPHELLVVDQTDGPSTEDALRSIEDERLRYVRAKVIGKGAALNEGLRLAGGEIVVCTDDDCEAPDGWVRTLAEVLQNDPGAAIAFSNVVASPHDRSVGYIPTYERKQSRVLHTVLDLCGGFGIGAGMAVRRQAVLDFGGFDESMGPGGLFYSCDEFDVTIRALQFGWRVRETVEASILHHGFRSYTGGREHVRRDWHGIGAMCSKSLRGGRPLGAVPTLWLFARAALWPPVKHLASLKKPSGLLRITSFAQGFVQGARTPVDRKHMLFSPQTRR